MKPRCVGVMLVLGSVAVGAAAQEGDPHARAAECRADPLILETTECGAVCAECHPGTDGPIEMYELGDRAICAQCHARAGDARPADRLLVSEDHGNHPVGVEYRRSTIRSRLDPYPSGPKLFWDRTGGAPKVYCSTCHNPHGSVDRLLRVSPPRDFCFACHVK